MILEMIVGAAVLGAGWRMRGSSSWTEWTGLGGFWAKLLCCAVPAGLLTYWQTQTIYEPIAMAAAMFVATTIPWWDSLDMGMQQGTWLRDFAVNTGAGILRTSGMAAVAFLAFGLWWPLLAAGALSGLVYTFGYSVYKTKGSIIAECMNGALMGAALMYSLHYRLAAWLFG